MANHPDDLAARAQLVEQAHTLAAGFSQLDSALATQRSSSVDELASIIDEVNNSATRIAELNQNITSALNNGFSPNELMDQRDLLIAQLADQVGVTVRPGENGTVDVFVGGTAIVRDNKASPLQVEVGTDPAQTLRVTWARGESDVPPPRPVLGDPGHSVRAERAGQAETDPAALGDRRQLPGRRLRIGRRSPQRGQ